MTAEAGRQQAPERRARRRRVDAARPRLFRAGRRDAAAAGDLADPAELRPRQPLGAADALPHGAGRSARRALPGSADADPRPRRRPRRPRPVADSHALWRDRARLGRGDRFARLGRVAGRQGGPRRAAARRAARAGARLQPRGHARAAQFRHRHGPRADRLRRLADDRPAPAGIAPGAVQRRLGRPVLLPPRRLRRAGAAGRALRGAAALRRIAARLGGAAPCRAVLSAGAASRCGSSRRRSIRA